MPEFQLHPWMETYLAWMGAYWSGSPVWRDLARDEFEQNVPMSRARRPAPTGFRTTTTFPRRAVRR